jgi:hypothetical protein
MLKISEEYGKEAFVYSVKHLEHFSAIILLFDVFVL